MKRSDRRRLQNESYTLSDITIPLDFETEAHRGFAFVEFEDVADAAAARDNMDEAELFGRTLKVNIARPIKVRTVLWI